MKKIACLFLFSALAYPQAAKKANEGYQTKEGREAVAKSLSDSHREETQKPREIVEALALKEGQSVADVGTGVGFMIPYLSHAVRATGTVYAEDIQTDFLDRARLRAQVAQVTNVKFILGTDRDPKLPADTLEGVLMLDVYHHFDYPETMLGYVRDSLVSDGKLVIVEYYKRRGAMGGGDRALEHIRVDQDDLITEVETSGFRLVSKRDLVPNSQYMAVFTKK